MTTQSRNKREGWYQGRNYPKIRWEQHWEDVNWNPVRGHRRTKTPYSRLHKPKLIFEMEIGRVEGFRIIFSDLITP